MFSPDIDRGLSIGRTKLYATNIKIDYSHGDTFVIGDLGYSVPRTEITETREYADIYGNKVMIAGHSSLVTLILEKLESE